jgi:hypothetical protein
VGVGAHQDGVGGGSELGEPIYHCANGFRVDVGTAMRGRQALVKPVVHAADYLLADFVDFVRAVAVGAEALFVQSGQLAGGLE